MKPRQLIISSFALAAFLLIVGSCSKRLEEHPYTVFSVSYLQTVSGVQAGLVSLYSNMRYEYGPEGTNGLTCDGTDEWTYGDQPRTGVGGTADYLTLGNYTLDPTNGAIQTPWNRNFSSINLANGIITWAPTSGLDSVTAHQVVAQAKFLRGLYYLLLVEEFGAVPLDLGSGPLQFNEKAFQGFNRLPTDSVEGADFQAMINDFTYASQNLPVTRPAGAFRLSQAAAYLMLSRVYMFRAYSKYKQSTDFASAYQAAITVVNNPGTYGTGLLSDYGMVLQQGNDYNQEILYSVERIPGDLNDNEATSGQIGGGKENDATNDFNADYTSVQSPTATSGIKPCGTRTIQYGRPLRRFCPTAWLFDTAFADKYNDSRYNNTFRTVFRCSQVVTGFAIGDTGFILANTNQIADSMNAIPKKYRVVAPREFYVIGGVYNQNIYPTLSKYSDSLKAGFNDPGGRPYPVAKLSECYLLAAEAAMQGGSPGGATEAAQLINVLRTRAAYRPGLLASDLAARQAAMAITASDINLDFIMDERTRELAGESIRWPDLAMRGILLARVTAHNPDAAAKLQAFHSLRPIPQEELDATDVANKASYQNPGY